MMLFVSYLGKNSIYRVSVICKLAMKWYQMRMCTSWLCPFKLYIARTDYDPRRTEKLETNIGSLVWVFLYL